MKKMNVNSDDFEYIGEAGTYGCNDFTHQYIPDYGDGTITFPSQQWYYEYPYMWYRLPCPKEKKETELTIEGTPEEVANLIRHFACRLKITIESLGEDEE